MNWLAAFLSLCCAPPAVAGTIYASSSLDAIDAKFARQPACGDYCNETPKPPLACGNYLKQMGRQHPDVEFEDCRSVVMDAPKVPGFKASYRVKGKDIERVEAWLIKWAHMNHFIFMCCGWDTLPSYYEDKDGTGYEISMFADAEINGSFVSQRKDLAKIPYATLTITHWLYAP